MYVVFGATGGIGGALAELLAAQPGARLLLSGRNGERLAGVVARATAAGPGAQVASLAADPLDCAAVEGVVGEAVKRYGRVDGVANCVGSVLLKSGASLGCCPWVGWGGGGTDWLLCAAARRCCVLPWLPHAGVLPAPPAEPRTAHLQPPASPWPPPRVTPLAPCLQRTPPALLSSIK